MDEIKKLKEQFIVLELQEKINFINTLTHFFEEKEIDWAHRYDNNAVEEKFKLLENKKELKELIFSLKDQNWITLNNPYDEGNLVWNTLQQYFNATSSD